MLLLVAGETIRSSSAAHTRASYVIRVSVVARRRPRTRGQRCVCAGDEAGASATTTSTEIGRASAAPAAKATAAAAAAAAPIGEVGSSIPSRIRRARGATSRASRAASGCGSGAASEPPACHLRPGYPAGASASTSRATGGCTPVACSSTSATTPGLDEEGPAAQDGCVATAAPAIAPVGCAAPASTPTGGGRRCSATDASGGRS